jgi:hypothetical protein
MDNNFVSKTNSVMTREKIIELCVEYGIRDYTICTDDQGLYIDVNGSVFLSYFYSDFFTLRFGSVMGHFDCGDGRLTSLEGCPREVSGYFACNNNELTSLEGCPTKVGGSFFCGGNKLSVESYYHLFELGYDVGCINVNFDLVGLRRQWVLDGIINE